MHLSRNDQVKTRLQMHRVRISTAVSTKAIEHNSHQGLLVATGGFKTPISSFQNITHEKRLELRREELFVIYFKI